MVMLSHHLALPLTQNSPKGRGGGGQGGREVDMGPVDVEWGCGVGSDLERQGWGLEQGQTQR